MTTHHKKKSPLIFNYNIVYIVEFRNRNQQWIDSNDKNDKRLRPFKQVVMTLISCSYEWRKFNLKMRIHLKPDILW